MTIRTETRAIASLRPYERNTKLHPQSQIDSIIASIQRFGFNDPIGVTEAGVIVEGHGRLEAATQLGMTEVPVLVLPDSMTEDMIDLYRIAHNKLALTSTFDFGMLADQLREIVQGGAATFADMGFDDKSVASLFEMVAAPVPVQGGGTGGSSQSDSDTSNEFEVVFDTAGQRDRFKAFLEKVKATYGGGSGEAMSAMIADAMSGNLVPTGIQHNPATADNVENLSWH